VVPVRCVFEAGSWRCGRLGDYRLACRRAAHPHAGDEESEC
jgi:hypothetical protein